jgi:metal-sulfur cluster biosynthetic enzyme/nitrite reductase/ring-hydroxylating ferredoxin subunit
MGFERVANVSEITEGGRLSIEVDEVPALLIRLEGHFYAVEDLCTHDGQPLTDGPIIGDEIKCPRHGARFQISTGKAMCMPATSGIRTFAVEVRGDEVFVSDTAATTPAKAPVETIAADTAVPATAAAVNADGSVLSPTQTALAEAETQDQYLTALRDVIDPELMINIVDLGLIYGVTSLDGGNVEVEMTLTSPACPAGPQIVHQARMALERLESVEAATIKLTMSPPWTPDRMTDEARDQLGIF